MAFSFPTSPTLNQQYTFGTKTWRYNGTGWVLVTGTDAAQSAWSTANLAYVQANTATNIGQAAYDSSNTKFSSSGGTITGAVSIGNDLTVSGNLSVLGTTFSINASSIVANDSLLVLGLGNYTSDILDIGFAGHYNDGVNAHAGFIRDAGTKEWYLFKGYVPEVNANNNIILSDPSFKVDTLNANLRSSNIILNGSDLNSYINSAYYHANSSFIKANASFDTGNSAFIQANAAFLQANTPDYVANSAASYANSAFASANSAAIYANGAFAAANAATATDTTQNNSITAAFNTANAAFITANASYNVLMVAYETQGTGACTTFSLGFKPYAANSIFVSVDGVLQSDTTYSVNSVANTITFTEAPASYESLRIVGFKQVNPYNIDDNITSNCATIVCINRVIRTCKCSSYAIVLCCISCCSSISSSKCSICSVECSSYAIILSCIGCCRSICSRECSSN